MNLRNAARVALRVSNWPTYLANQRGRLREGPIEYRLRNGLRFTLRPGPADHGIFYEVWVRETYTPPGFEIGRRDQVVDIGAHVGMFACQAASRAREGRVVAFEPTPLNFRALQEHARVNRLSNLLPVQAAITDKTGPVEFHLSPVNTGGHSLVKAAEHNERIRVEGVRLAEALERHAVDRVDFLKMDCEGAEYVILPSLEEDTFRRIARLSLEYQDYDQARSGAVLQRLLERQGYRVRRRDDWKMLYARR